MTRHAFRLAAFLALAAGGYWFVDAGDKPADPVPPKGKADAPAGTGAEAEFRKILDAYEAAFNKPDLDALMSYWADDAEFLDENGKTTRGKDKIKPVFAKALAAHKGRAIAIKITNLHLLRNGTALLDGTVASTEEDDASTAPFSSVWLKSDAKGDGKWQLVRVQDLPAEGEPEGGANYKNLKELEWLVGDWTADDGRSVTALTVKWMQDKNFLTLDHKVAVKGVPAVALTTIVGFDATEGRIRSWTFDSTGAWGGGLWTRKGNAWTTDAAGVLPDGRVGGARNVWKFGDKDSFEWESTDRQVDKVPSADIKLKFVRKKAAAK